MSTKQKPQTERTPESQKPFFTIRKNEWESLGPKGQAAMLKLAEAIVKAHYGKHLLR